MVQDSSAKHFGVYPVWWVSLTAAEVQITAASGLGAVTIDGLSLPKGAKTVTVLPGRHRVEAAIALRPPAP